MEDNTNDDQFSCPSQELMIFKKRQISPHFLSSYPPVSLFIHPRIQPASPCNGLDPLLIPRPEASKDKKIHIALVTVRAAIRIISYLAEFHKYNNQFIDFKWNKGKKTWSCNPN